MKGNTDIGDNELEDALNREPEEISNATNESNETETIVSKTKREKMETHAYHLHRAPGKKIWHYFFEFLMLFIAVFCGFIAENARERYVENKRELEFIESLIEDLKSDTLQSKKTLRQLRQKSINIDSVLIALSSSEIISNSNATYKLWTKSLGLETFISNDRTIQQLKNSGGLRLIRNSAVSNRIMEYDQTLRKYYIQSNLMYSALRDQTMYSKLFDFNSLNKNINTPVPLTDQGAKLLNESYANLQLWNYGLIGLIGWLERVSLESENLLLFIQQEYSMNE